jgi:hypothetical protein
MLVPDALFDRIRQRSSNVEIDTIGLRVDFAVP